MVKRRCAEPFYRFAFSLLVPPNTAPSMRCEQGLIYYKLVASLPDAGLLGGPTNAERRLLLQVSHSEEKNGYPPSFNFEREIYHDRFGPLRTELTSRFLLVAGYLRVYFYMPDIPCYSRPELWTVEMVQTVEVGKDVHQSKFSLWRSDEDPLAAHFNGLLPMQDDEGPWLFSSRQMRLPFDDRISSTTHPFSDTPIRVSHRFVIRLIFYQYDGPGSDTLQADGFPGGIMSKQMLEFFSGPAVIASCSSRLELSKLPTYEESAKERHTCARAYMAKDCLCRQPTEAGDATELAYGITRDQVRQAFEAGEQQRAWAFRQIRQKTETRAAEYAFLRRPVEVPARWTDHDD